MDDFNYIVILKISKINKVVNFILGLLLEFVFISCYINLKQESSIVYKIIAFFLIIFCLYFLINTLVKKVIITEEYIKEKNLFYSKRILFNKVTGLTKYKNYGLIVKKRFNNIKISHEYDKEDRIIAIDYVLTRLGNVSK